MIDAYRGECMMRYKALVLVLLLLAACGGSGLCMMLTDTFPADQKMYPVSKTPQPPEELTRLYNLGNRVYGERDSFSQIGDTEKAYYTGDTEAFNGFLQQYVKVKIRPLKLIIHTGCAEVIAHSKEAIHYDWMLSRYLAGTKSMDPSGAEETVAVNLYPGCKIDLSKLNIPTEIEVTSGGELEKVVSDHREKRAPVFAIYLLKNTHWLAEDARKRDIESLELQDTPLFTLDDFLYYKWEDHTFKLTEDAINRLPDPGVFGIPFVVVADGKRLYLGAFWTALSSAGFPEPVIIVHPWDRNAEYRIDRAYAYGNIGEGSDPRGNPAVKEAFAKAGKLR